MDNRRGPRHNLAMVQPGVSRHRMASMLNTAYGDGLLSESTFVERIDRLYDGPLVEPAQLIGDLTVRVPTRTMPTVIARALHSAQALIGGRSREPVTSPTLLALDWSGGDEELIVGRAPGCDVVLGDCTVSRRHARLRFRDGGWVLQDLESTNGTRVNDVRVGRCRLCPGDRLTFGDQQIRVD